MKGQDDKAAGKVKEAAGKLTRDPELEAEGKTEQAGGSVQQAAEKAADTAKGAVRGVRESDRRR